MKTFITTAALALSLLTVPAAAQQVRGIEGATAHINQTQDAPNDRILVPQSRLDGVSRSSRSGDLSPAARRAIEINDASAETSTERRVLRNDRLGSQGFSTQASGNLSRAARIAIAINNGSAESSTGRIVINR
ncbi:MAG: hypothetical protein AAF366_00695 [Pseudomonadota bacterium]